MIFLALVAAFGLAAVHLFSGGLSFLDGVPRSRWLSVAGGVSVAYVFVHLLPELAENQEVIAETVDESFAFLAFFEDHVYLVALLGLAIFYGLERAAKESRRRQPGSAEKASASAGVFWIHIASFSFYNAVIGYLLVHREGSLIFFFVAMALHFVVNDRSLREHHRGLYHKMGRWLLAGAVVVGWVLGSFHRDLRGGAGRADRFLGGRCDPERPERGATGRAPEPLLGFRSRRRRIFDIAPSALMCGTTMYGTIEMLR